MALRLIWGYALQALCSRVKDPRVLCVKICEEVEKLLSPQVLGLLLESHGRMRTLLHDFFIIYRMVMAIDWPLLAARPLKKETLSSSNTLHLAHSIRLTQVSLQLILSSGSTVRQSCT